MVRNYIWKHKHLYTENEIDNILEECIYIYIYIYIVALILSVKAPLHENSGIVTQGYNIYKVVRLSMMCGSHKVNTH